MKEFLWIIDLQLFADDGTGEKTEQATPRKREDTRKKGQVYKSNDLSSAFILIAGSMAMVFSFPYMVRQLADFSKFYLSSRTLDTIDLYMVSQMMVEAALLLAKICFPVGLACFISALVINLAQVGFLFSPEAMSFKLNRLDPIQGFKQKFSKRALVELIKSLLKPLYRIQSV